MPNVRLDLRAIEHSLLGVREHFDQINATLDTEHDPFSDEVLGHMMAGYRFLDQLQEGDIDLFAVGNSRLLLHLNCLIVCEPRQNALAECSEHFRETERRFYDDSNRGGIRALMNYLADHRHPSVWERAAGVYMQTLSSPQLFFEGNHRTGALLISHILLRGGEPPFVLNVQNAKAYFEPSSLIKGYRKGSLRAMFQAPRLRTLLAELLQTTVDPRHLLTPASMRPKTAHPHSAL
ncbi:hypothetical protein [Imhoffiella purpurea]|uniref:Fido domain-containing protein n=1 Tax=Imhoffiella purpurea TaxID=1249627 RepID=W9V6U7_9GAMM|nr:hypothetical protein [Imhoffiella purpurea]EXJ12626.1 hypothetical protein D779_4044 [Imhoffiella purpurea]